MKILALDLEGTLISNAMSQIPRPYLNYFLEEIKSQFDKIVIYTTVSERKYKEILSILIEEKSVPEWFKDVEYIKWSGKYKDLKYVSNNIEETYILDDYEGYILPEQKSQWIKIEQYEYPYSNEDNELLNILKSIKDNKKAT